MHTTPRCPSTRSPHDFNIYSTNFTDSTVGLRYLLNQTTEDKPMDQDIFAGQWKQMRGTMNSWWGKLADDDFERIGGQTDKLIGWVQEHYGQTREQAQQEGERHMKAYKH